MLLFQKSVTNKYIKNLDAHKVGKAFEKFQKFYGNKLRLLNIMQLKEENYQEGFLREVFVETLGYTINPDENYNLTTEYKNQKDARKADGAILKDGKAIGVIELKSTKTKNLESIKEQAFGYKNNQSDCRYVITSNFQSLRFYVDNATEYEEFDLFNLSKEQFKLLYLLLSKESIFSDLPKKLKRETKFYETDITDRLYADYKHFKDGIFENIVKNNPQYDKLTLFKKSQKLLDRFLFVFFAEDCGLIPPNTISKVISDWKNLKKLNYYQPLYKLFKDYFSYLDKGKKIEDWGQIPAYNGGLFTTDEILDNPEFIIDDIALEKDSLTLSSYDFNSEVDVNILGHIFEHSLNEIEEITAELSATRGHIPLSKKISKRKKDGVFYTPKYITKYIVENTVGTLCNEKKEELQLNNLLIDDSFRKKDKKLNGTGKKLFKTLNSYKDWLLTLKILDPACGSGAFLNQTLDFLIAEHKQADDLLLELTGDNLRLFDTDKAILENNIFGVDINEESVDIAKLSLWLRTAQKGRPLSDLNNNIKCGNSLIDDPKIAGDKAFDWSIEFKDIMDNGGFDVVIGNPPYVNIANISNKKERDYLKKEYKTVKNKSDLYSIFTEKSFHLLKENKIFSFIFSNSWLSTSSFEQFRKFLVKNTQILELIKLPAGVFTDATVNTIIIVFRKKIVKSNKINLKECVNEQFIEMKHTLDYERINFTTYKTFSFKPEIIFKIDTIKLGEIAKFSVGIKTANDKRFIFNEKINNEYYPFMQGKDIQKYFNGKVKKYIWYKPDLMQERKGAVTLNLDLFSKPKILIKDIAQSIQCSYDENNLLCKNTINILYKLSDNYLMKYILACLNSKFMTVWFNNTFISGLHLQLNQLQEIPIVEISKEAQQPFVEKADLMLLLNKELQTKAEKFIKRIKANLEIVTITNKLKKFYDFEFKTFITELKKQKIKLKFKEQDEWEDYFDSYKTEINNLQIKINQTDKEIDKMIYEIYELTSEEIEIVENSVKYKNIKSIGRLH